MIPPSDWPAIGRPGRHTPCLGCEPILEDQPQDYAGPAVRLKNSRSVEFLHPVSDVVTALIDAGLRIDRFHERDSVSWQMLAEMAMRGRREYVWPDRPWLPLSYSLRAARP